MEALKDNTVSSSGGFHLLSLCSFFSTTSAFYLYTGSSFLFYFFFFFNLRLPLMYTFIGCSRSKGQKVGLSVEKTLQCFLIQAWKVGVIGQVLNKNELNYITWGLVSVTQRSKSRQCRAANPKLCGHTPNSTQRWEKKKFYKFSNKSSIFSYIYYLHVFINVRLKWVQRKCFYFVKIQIKKKNPNHHHIFNLAYLKGCLHHTLRIPGVEWQSKGKVYILW